jgi:hypothetical protein
MVIQVNHISVCIFSNGFFELTQYQVIVSHATYLQL